jgi:tetratricopeptide (TPR) repeat protein
MVVLAGLVVLWIIRQHFLSGTLGILIFAVSFSPVSNFLVTIGTILGERLLYLPMVGFAIFLGAVLCRLVSVTQERRYVYAGLAILLGLYGVLTVTRNRDWRNDVTLFSAAVHDGNRSAKVYYNLGVGYRKQKRFDEAIEAFERVVEQKPTEPDSWKYLGIVYAEQGQHAKAAGVYEVAVKLDSTQVDLWKQLGGQREALEDWERAERMYARALELADDDTDLHFSMARMCRHRNRPTCAIRHCLFVLEADAEHRDAAVMLGQLYLETGQLEEARALVDAMRTRWSDVPEVRVLIQKLGL